MSLVGPGTRDRSFDAGWSGQGGYAPAAAAPARSFSQSRVRITSTRGRQLTERSSGIVPATCCPLRLMAASADASECRCCSSRWRGSISGRPNRTRPPQQPSRLLRESRPKVLGEKWRQAYNRKGRHSLPKYYAHQRSLGHRDADALLLGSTWSTPVGGRSHPREGVRVVAC